MKNKLIAIILGVSVSIIPTAAISAPATKTVCKVVKGKTQCKKIKVHKKFKGTPVPSKAKKK